MAAAKQFLRAVKIRQDAVQKMRALYQAGFERSPLRRRNQEGDGIQIPGAVHAERIAVDIVSNAVFPNSLAGDLPAAGKLFAPSADIEANERVPMRTEHAGRGGHLVIDAVRLAVTGAQERRFERVSGNAHKGSATGGGWL